MKLRIHISFGRESSGDGVGTTGGDGPQHNAQWACADEEALDFSLLLSALGPAGLRPLQRRVQGLSPSIWVSQVGSGGSGGVILFSVSSFNQKNKTKQPKTKQWGAQSMDLLVSQLSQGCLAGLTHPRSSCCREGTNHSTCEHSHSCLLVSPLSSPLLSPVLYPSYLLGPLEVSEIPNFQSSFSIFSIYWDFYNGSWPEEVQHLPHL